MLTHAYIMRHLKVALGLPSKDMQQIFHMSKERYEEVLYRNLPNSALSLDEIERFKKIEPALVLIKRSLSFSPGALVKDLTENETTLFELLCMDEIDIHSIESICVLIGKKLISRRGTGLRSSSEVELYCMTKHA